MDESLAVSLLALATVLGKSIYELVKKPPANGSNGKLSELTRRLEVIEEELRGLNGPNGWLRMRLHDLANKIAYALLVAERDSSKRKKEGDS